MKGKRRKKIRYTAKYEGNELNLGLEKINLRIDLKDHLEVGVLLGKWRESGLGSSRELGRLFRRSPTTVINKESYSQKDNKRLIDRRGQKKRYKIEDIKGEIQYIWAKDPCICDREILQKLQGRLSSLNMRIDPKTLDLSSSVMR